MSIATDKGKCRWLPDIEHNTAGRLMKTLKEHGTSACPVCLRRLCQPSHCYAFHIPTCPNTHVFQVVTSVQHIHRRLASRIYNSRHEKSIAVRIEKKCDMTILLILYWKNIFNFAPGKLC